MKQFDARIKTKSDTTANWNNRRTFVPLKGEIIIYTDYETKTVDNEVVDVPALKIGDGVTYCVDLPFVSDDIREELLAHMSDADVHVTPLERIFWNNKINVTDSQEVVDNVLIFNRN